MTQAYRELRVSAFDGLRLHARDYGPAETGALPVVCLPGLARTSADFHELATALAGSDASPRRVLALDYRGRGQSEWDREWRNYDVRVEFGDVLQVLAAAGVEEAVFVGTSRGGLITMALAAARPTMIRGAVINDIGPIIDPRGLVRIRNYVGKLPQPTTLQEAIQLLQRISGDQFPTASAAQWEGMARGTWREEDGRLVARYDPNLLRGLENLDLNAPLPVLWPFFEALRNVPVMALRGALSDILSGETLAEMKRRHPALDAVVVPDQGHAPLLESELVQRIAAFVGQIDAAQ